jgi:hypothetical protein
LWYASPGCDGSAKWVSWLQHYKKSRESYVGGAPLPVDVRGAFASEVAVVDSLHQSPSFWRPPGRQDAKTRGHVHFVALPKEIRPAVLHLDCDYIER